MTRTHVLLALPNYRTWTVFKHQPNQVLRHHNFVEPGDVRMDELAMVVNLAG